MISRGNYVKFACFFVAFCYLYWRLIIRLGQAWAKNGSLSDNPSLYKYGQADRSSIHMNYKQLLDGVFVISKIIKVEVGVISRRPRLITLTETLIIMDITKTECNNCFIIHSTKQKKQQLMFVLLH